MEMDMGEREFGKKHAGREQWLDLISKSPVLSTAAFVKGAHRQNHSSISCPHIPFLRHMFVTH